MPGPGSVACPKPRARVADRLAYKRAKERELSAAKAAVWKRCGGHCERCGARVTRRPDSLLAGHVHHKKFRSQGGTNDVSNLQVVCAICHAVLHNLRVK